ncbi:MAG: NMD3-related protein, partial [Methanocellales archaeon]|nr:NMD3-related protein [Methanocellales archaeon]
MSTVISQLNINPAAEDVHVAFEPETLGEIMRVHVHVDAVVKGMAASKDVDVDVRIERESCDRCRRITGGYYEGIVQVRAENRFPTSEERSRCKEIAAAIIDQKSDRMAFILDIRELKEGIDIYVAPIHVGKQISKAITEEFGGKLSEAAKLAGRRDGREFYRVSFAVRLPQFLVGDIIFLGDHVIDIARMGKRVVGRNLKTGAQFTSDVDDLGGAELLCHRSDAQTTVLTMVQDDEIQVLDPDSYEPRTLPRPAFL